MCNPNKKPHTVVDFPLAKGMLFSTLATEMDVNHQIRSLSNFMEQCLDEWLQYVNKNRQVIPISCISKSIILSGTARNFLRRESKLLHNKKNVDSFSLKLLF